MCATGSINIMPAVALGFAEDGHIDRQANIRLEKGACNNAGDVQTTQSVMSHNHWYV